MATALNGSRPPVLKAALKSVQIHTFLKILYKIIHYMIESKRIYGVVLNFFSPSVGSGQHLSMCDATTLDEAVLSAKKTLKELKPEVTNCTVHVSACVDVCANIPDPIKTASIEFKPPDVPPVDYKALTLILKNEYANSTSEKKALQAIIKRLKKKKEDAIIIKI